MRKLILLLMILFIQVSSYAQILPDGPPLGASNKTTHVLGPITFNAYGNKIVYIIDTPTLNGIYPTSYRQGMFAVNNNTLFFHNGVKWLACGSSMDSVNFVTVNRFTDSLTHIRTYIATKIPYTDTNSLIATKTDVLTAFLALTTSINTKEPIITAGGALDYWAGDKTFKSTSLLPVSIAMRSAIDSTWKRAGNAVGGIIGTTTLDTFLFQMNRYTMLRFTKDSHFVAFTNPLATTSFNTAYNGNLNGIWWVGTPISGGDGLLRLSGQNHAGASLLQIFNSGSNVATGTWNKDGSAIFNSNSSGTTALKITTFPLAGSGHVIGPAQGSIGGTALGIASYNQPLFLQPFGGNYTDSPVIIGGGMRQIPGSRGKLQVFGAIQSTGNIYAGDSIAGSTAKIQSLGNLAIASGGYMVIGAANPAANAALDIVSTTKGLLPPRMTMAQRNAIPTPTLGLTVICIDCKGNDSTLGVSQMYQPSTGLWKNSF